MEVKAKATKISQSYKFLSANLKKKHLEEKGNYYSSTTCRGNWWLPSFPS